MKNLFITLLLAFATIHLTAQPLTVSTNKLNDICYQAGKGYINVNPAGGTTPYTFLWNDGATVQNKNQLFAGVYTVTVTDAVSATKSAVVTITEPAAPLSYSVVVNGNEASAVNVAGGTAPYTYVWAGTNPLQTTATATGLLPTTYFVTVRDKKNCFLKQAAVIQ